MCEYRVTEQEVLLWLQPQKEEMKGSRLFHYRSDCEQRYMCRREGGVSSWGAGLNQGWELGKTIGGVW